MPPVARSFALMMAGEAAWALFEALELVVVDIETKKVCFMLRATGCVTLVLSLLATVLLYTGRAPWVKPARFSLVCARPFCCSGSPGPIPGTISTGSGSGTPGLTGTGSQCRFMGRYSGSLRLLLRPRGGRNVSAGPGRFQSAGVYRAQAVVMLFAVLVPWIINIVDMTRILGFIHVDTAAMTSP